MRDIDPSPVARSAPCTACAAALFTVLLSACAAVGPDYRPPETAVPAGWQAASSSGAADMEALAHWWRRFDDPVLDDLVERALAANPDIRTALAQLREARERRDLAASALGPTLTASASASRSKNEGEPTRELYDAGFDAAWEPDVFGGTRRGVQAADADVDASLESFHGVRVTLVAEVARNYAELRTGERRLDIAEANLIAQQELYDLTRWRNQAGLASELEEAQALTLLQQTRAALPTLRTAVSASRHRLAVLLALPPGALAQTLGITGEIPLADDRVAVGIPADTLRQRPDVRAAERRLAAQTARLGAAEAERYPSLRLTGALGLQAESLSAGATASTSLLAGLTAPIFDSGRIRANIAVEDARLEQARLAYQSSVLGALEEVENALVSLAGAGRRQAELTLAVASARRALEFARQQYGAGLADFQTVLDSQRTVLSLEDQLATSAGSHGTALIQLYKALGGGWTSEPVPARNGHSS